MIMIDEMMIIEMMMVDESPYSGGFNHHDDDGMSQYDTICYDMIRYDEVCCDVMW